jgi:hypothetical protein
LRYILARRIIELGSASRASCNTQRMHQQQELFELANAQWTPHTLNSLHCNYESTPDLRGCMLPMANSQL